MPKTRSKSPRRYPATGTPGDWRGKDGRIKPASLTVPFPLTESAEDIYAELENPKTSALSEVMKAVESGRAVIDDAVLFCGRFDQDGMLLRESSKLKPYRILRTRGPREYREAMKTAGFIWKDLPKKIQEAQREKRDRAWRRREAQAKLKGRRFREDFFQSGSDLGSTYQQDPNQFTEYTPYFNGPFAKQQYFDYFKGHARAFEAINHNPIAKRIIDILTQYTLGRGFKVKCRNQANDKKWQRFNSENRITHKMRKYWLRELLTYGENFIDVLRWISIDPSTIYDIVCEGYDEYIDKVLYYQQMFQTATQLYSGIAVPGVASSKDSKVGHYIVRQIPYDQIIHVKIGVMSVEKRGRSVLYSVLGWLKRLKDLYEAQVLGEQLRASFVWDDKIEGDEDDVASHAAKYNYIPIAPSIFVHNESVERKPLAPMDGVNSSGAANIGQEIIALIATSQGIPKDHFNTVGGSGSRATAIVGSEPFTKVIEDTQEECSDLIHQIIRRFCLEEGIDYIEDEWQVNFPSVVKDTTKDRLGSIALCESQGWFTKKRAATMAAAEMEQDEYDYETEQKDDREDKTKRLAAGLPGSTPTPPAGRFPQNEPKNPIHGDGKQEIIDQHKQL